MYVSCNREPWACLLFPSFPLCQSAKTFIFSIVTSELFDVCCTSWHPCQCSRREEWPRAQESGVYPSSKAFLGVSPSDLCTHQPESISTRGSGSLVSFSILLHVILSYQFYLDENTRHFSPKQFGLKCSIELEDVNRYAFYKSICQKKLL